MPHPVTNAHIAARWPSGLRITDHQTTDGQHRVTAIDPDTMETYIVTHPDLYAAVCEIAQGVEFDVNAGGGHGGIRPIYGRVETPRRLQFHHRSVEKNGTHCRGAAQERSIYKRAEGKVPTMPLRIPQRFEKSLADLIAMPHDKRQRLKELIGVDPPLLDRDKLATDIASSTKLGKDKVTGIVSMLMSLYRVIQDTPIDEFVGEVCDAVRTSRKVEAKEVDWSSFKQDLTALLSCDETFGVTAKALDIRKQHPHVYCTARILTDIRPVFKQDAEAGPVAAFVIHALRISSHDEGDFSTVKDFFFSLDADDLRELSKLIDRAIMKEASLKSLIQTSDVHHLELEGH